MILKLYRPLLLFSTIFDDKSILYTPVSNRIGFEKCLIAEDSKRLLSLLIRFTGHFDDTLLKDMLFVFPNLVNRYSAGSLNGYQLATGRNFVLVCVFYCVRLNCLNVTFLLQHLQSNPSTWPAFVNSWSLSS